MKQPPIAKRKCPIKPLKKQKAFESRLEAVFEHDYSTHLTPIELRESTANIDILLTKIL